MNKLKLYKVLRADMTSPFQRFQFEIGKTYYEPNIDLGDNSCARGIYATGVEGLLYSYREDRIVLECEVWGKRKEFNQFQRRFEYIRLLRKVPKREIKAKAKALEPKLGYKLSKVFFSVNPLAGKAKVPTAYDVKLLKEWVRIDSVGVGYVGISVADHIRKTIVRSKWTYANRFLFQYHVLEDGIVERLLNKDLLSEEETSYHYESINDFIFAYKSSLFPGIMEWEGFDHKSGKNPFQSAVSLWNRGFVVSFDGKFWRLHSGFEAKVVYETKEKDILS